MSNEIMASIGLRIAKLRGERRLSQKQLTDELNKNGLNIRRETVTQWENGTRDLKTIYSIKLADFFGVTCDYILRGIESENVQISKETGLTNNSINNLKRLNSMHRGFGDLTLPNAINSFIGNEGFVQFLLAFWDYQLEVKKLVDSEHNFMERLASYDEQLPAGMTILEYAAILALETEYSLYGEAHSVIEQADSVNYKLYKLEQALKRIADIYREKEENNGKHQED